MEDDSPLLTPEEPRRAEPDASRAKQNRRDDSPLLTPEEPRQEADASRVKHAKRPRPAAEAAAPEEPEVAFCRSDSSTLGAFGKTSSAEKYRKIEKVGVGAYGNVFKAENCETKEIVAIKVTFRQEDPLVGGFPVSLLREIGILKRVRHENIVQIHEVAHTPQGDPLVVMEFCQASLLELIHSQKTCLSAKSNTSFGRFSMQQTTCTNGASSIETWRPRTCSSTFQGRLRFVTLGSHEWPLLKTMSLASSLPRV